MKNLKKLLFVITLFLPLSLQALGHEAPVASMPNAESTPQTSISIGEKLSYNIYFHMGFIWAKAGYGELSFKSETRHGAQQLHGRLAAKSLNIVEHIMKVRDTLDCWFNYEMLPIEFRKGTHEGSYNAIAHYQYSPYWHNAAGTHSPANVDSTSVSISRWRKKGKDEADTDDLKLSNPGVAYDMLSVFYSIRNLNYATMPQGKKMQFTCYDGIKCQTINVEYIGPENCKLRNDKKYDAYLIYLTFDTKGENATPLKVWLSKTPDHRPVKAVIALKRIGSVQCEISE